MIKNFSFETQETEYKPQSCTDLHPGELLNAVHKEWPLFEVRIYGDATLSKKLSKRLICGVKHLPLRLSLTIITDTEAAIEAGISRDPTLFVNGKKFIEELVNAEALTVKFELLLKENIMSQQSQIPTPEMVEAMMLKNFGKLPDAMESVKKVDPSFFVEQAMSSKMSMKSEKNPLDAKTSTMIFLAAALAMNNHDCMEANTTALLNTGATKEEILAIVRIVRHAASSGVVGNAKTIFDALV